MKTVIYRNPAHHKDLHNGRKAAYFEGTDMLTCYWKRLPSDPKGVDGYRLTTNGKLMAVKLDAEGCATLSRA